MEEASFSPIPGFKIMGHLFGPMENSFITQNENCQYIMNPERLMFPHIHWIPTDNSKGVVKWNFDVTYYCCNGDIFIKKGFSISQETRGEFFHQIAMPKTEVISLEECGNVSIMFIKVGRNGMDIDDTYNGTASVIAIN